MTASDKEKMDANMSATINQQLVTVVLVLLIMLLALLVIGIVAGFLMMGGGMMNGGMMGMGSGTSLVTGSNGELIFQTGVDVRGVAVQNSMMLGMGGCAMCHGPDGHGGQMMGRTEPCNTFKCLSADGYTEDLIKRAITQGIAEDGHQLDLMMPRWQMSDSDLNDLINYLKNLP